MQALLRQLGWRSLRCAGWHQTQQNDAIEFEPLSPISFSLARLAFAIITSAVAPLPIPLPIEREPFESLRHRNSVSS
jgi:hypothetical protein